MDAQVAELLTRFTARDREGHKGTYGAVLVVGGSVGVAGAAALAGRAAIRSGAGLVRVVVPEPIASIVTLAQLECMTLPLPSDGSGKLDMRALEPILDAARNATVVAVGPGLGRSAGLNLLVAQLWKMLEVPAIFDADALNALAGVEEFPVTAPGITRVITPHPGEFARLVTSAKADDTETQRAEAVRWARDHAAIVVLKGAGTQVSDGLRTFRNTTGNPGMGTGGSGDVLTGILAAVLAQCVKNGISPLEAVRLGVHIHGLAGDLAARELGQVALIASDIIRFLPQVFLGRDVS